MAKGTPKHLHLVKPKGSDSGAGDPIIPTPTDATDRNPRRESKSIVHTEHLTSLTIDVPPLSYLEVLKRAERKAGYSVHCHERDKEACVACNPWDESNGELVTESRRYRVTTARTKNWVDYREARSHFGLKPSGTHSTNDLSTIERTPVCKNTICEINSLFYWLAETKGLKGFWVLFHRIGGSIVRLSDRRYVVPAFEKRFLRRGRLFFYPVEEGFPRGTNFVLLTPC